MFVFENPAVKALVAKASPEQVFGEVLIRRSGSTFELRHVADRADSSEALRPLAIRELRALAQFTTEGNFRPLKSAPGLTAGWRLAVANSAVLESALQQLYPGALADWFSAQSTPVPITDYRAYAQRQTGMYRITQLLSDDAARLTIRATCRPAACLKRRLWSVAELDPDAPAEKSVIPCLEPCALLLEAARKAARAEQEAQRPATELKPTH